MDLPVKLEIPGDRFPPEVEASAYFVIAEALTNVMKHSRATSAMVVVSVVDGSLSIEVQDNGIGGADPSGPGLVGINDRVTALGGRLEVGRPAEARCSPRRCRSRASCTGESRAAATDEHVLEPWPRARRACVRAKARTRTAPAVV